MIHDSAYVWIPYQSPNATSGDIIECDTYGEGNGW